MIRIIAKIELTDCWTENYLSTIFQTNWIIRFQDILITERWKQLVDGHKKKKKRKKDLQYSKKHTCTVIYNKLVAAFAVNLWQLSGVIWGGNSAAILGCPLETWRPYSTLRKHEFSQESTLAAIATDADMHRLYIILCCSMRTIRPPVCV